MKIQNDVTKSLHSTDKSTTTAKAATTGVIRPVSTASVGSVHISDASRSLATGVSNTEAPFDAKRVDAIKAAISSGHFKVNPEAIANKVIDSASQLLVGA